MRPERRRAARARRAMARLLLGAALAGCAGAVAGASAAGPSARLTPAGGTAKPATTAPERWSELTLPMFQAVGAPQGLGNVLVSAIAQDPHGFLWVATAGGLSRWDGYRFQNYTNDPDDPRSLPDNYVVALYTDRKGRLWAGTANGGLARYVPEDDGFVTYNPQSAGLAAGGVHAIAGDGGDGLWLATSGGLLHLDAPEDPARARATRYLHHATDPASLPADLVGALAVGADGTVFAGTDDGLAWRAPGGGAFTRVALPGYERRGVAVLALFVDHAGMVWIGTNGAGVFVFDPRTGRVGRHAAGAAAAALMKHVNVTAFAEPVPGELWVSSYSYGVAVIERASGRARHLTYEALVPGGLASGVVHTLFTDRAGALWIGTDKGLNQRAPAQAALSLAPRQNSRPGLSDNDATSVAEAPDHSVWVGLLRQGADVVDPQRRRVGHWPPSSTPAGTPATASAANVTALYARRDGKVLLATESGLFRADADGGAAKPLRAPWLDHRVHVRTLSEAAGSLWIGTATSGLLQARADGAGGLDLVKVRAVAGLGGMEISDLQPGPDGSLWVGTTAGLNRVDAVSGAVLEWIGGDRADPAALSHPSVNTLLTDRRGRLWVGTNGGLDVLERLAGGQRRFHRLGRTQGLPNTSICQLLEDAQGRIWASTDDGIAVIDPDSYAVGVLGAAEGALYSPYWARAGVASAAGELLFGGSGGVTIVRPERYRPWRLAAPLAVTEVRLGGKVVPPGRYNHAAGGPGPATLDVPAEANSFAVGFAALDFTAPELNQYAYRLDGFDRIWTYADAGHRLASYTNLPPGKYRLLIRGTNRAGVWSAHELALPVRVQPWWWQTWWFQGAAALLGLAALYGAYRLRIWRLAAQRGALEREVAARTAEVLRQKALADQQRGEAEREHRAASERNAELAAVNAVAQILAGKLELDQLIALVGDQVHRLFQSERTCINLLDDTDGTLRVAYVHGPEHAGSLAEAHQAALARLVASGRGELAGLGPGDAACHGTGGVADGDEAPAAPSCLYVPIIANGVVRGAVSVRRAVGAAGPYRASDQRLLDTIAAHLGAALQNARLFQQAEAARARAEEATQAKSMFLANMSHEIRTPMNAVIGLSYLALGTGSPSRQRDYLQKIHNAGNSLVGIISDILDFSKIEAGKLDLESADFDLDDLLAHVAAIAGGARGPALECNFDVPAAVPRRLRGDAQRLGQVLINLLNNALKFTTSGEVALAVRALDGQDARVQLEFSVRDSGIGMSAPQLGKLFQAFTQADNSSTRRFGGTGLGLSICKNLVDLMGGTIAVDSEPGVGSRFVVVVSLERAGEGLAPAPGLPAALDGLRVLVVDDSATARAGLLGTLDSLGLDAAAAACRQEVSRLLSGAARYDLVLVDAGMPGLDREWGAALEAAHGAPPKVALLTNVAGDEPDRTPCDGGVDACLVKPVTRAAMVDMLLGLYAPDQRQVAPDQRRAPPRFDGARVLLVEDNEINQEIAVGLLEACGVVVELANNGTEALDRLHAVDAARRYQLVFMDLHMPELDGHATTVRLRQDSRFDALPIIAMTANTMPAERQRCREEGFDGHLSKPLIPDELHRLLAGYLTAGAPGGRREQQAVFDGAVPGLDLAAARRGVDGDEALLGKVLRMFSRDERDRARRIRAALAQGDHADAERHAHSLRGLAESIGAARVARLAGDLERAARQPMEEGPPASAVAAALDALDGALSALCAELDRRLPPAAEAATGTVRAPGDWLAELRRLDQLMLAGDTGAIALFAAGAADFAASFGSWDAEAIQRSLDERDFDGARAALRWVAHKHALDL
ncbi:response regulator [Oxalobacteraceae bacterium OTU3CINTB1]|nr:response regulator [Oxalobacteraceae bacterium OTU3CINTB1]